MNTLIERSEFDDKDKAFGLTQTQIASLLGVTPQAVSKGIDTDGWAFYSKENRAQKLYTALLTIGTDKYVMSAERIKDMALALGWGILDTALEKTVRPATLYAESDEIWFFSDSPGSIISWDDLSKTIYDNGKENDIRKINHKVICFFMKTLDAAGRWVEFLEREVLKPAVENYRKSLSQYRQQAVQMEKSEHNTIQYDGANQYKCYVFVIVSNTQPYSPDFVISNPGSRCMDVLGTTARPTAYCWTGNSYLPLDWRPNGFVNICQICDIGTNPIKANFFPHGLILTKNVVDYPPEYTDGLILKSGHTHIEAKENGDLFGEKMAGGILETTTKRSDTAIAFNFNSKFCPAFILTYKRRPGDRCKKDGKIIAEIQKEILNSFKDSDRPSDSIDEYNDNEELRAAKKTGLLNF